MPSTLWDFRRKFRHIIHLAIDAEYITKNPFANFRLQVKCPDRAFLTQEEVEKMIATHIDNKKIEQAKDIFLFCCFTGLSYSDVFSLTKQQIQQSFSGKLWIKGKRQKMDIEYNIPLLNIPQLILERLLSYTRPIFLSNYLSTNSIKTTSAKLRQLRQNFGKNIIQLRKYILTD
jgi:integrase